MLKMKYVASATQLVEVEGSITHSKVKWEWKDDPNCQRDRDHLVRRVGTEHLRSESTHEIAFAVEPLSRVRNVIDLAHNYIPGHSDQTKDVSQRPKAKLSRQ